MSLADQIKRAGSIAEVKALLEKGRTFKYPSEKTKRRWQENAERRIQELEHEAKTN